MLPHGPAALNELADAAPLPDLRTLLLATRRFGSKPKRLICQTSAPHPSPDGMNGALRCQDLPGAPSVPMVGADSRRPLRERALARGRTDRGRGGDFSAPLLLALWMFTLLALGKSSLSGKWLLPILFIQKMYCYYLKALLCCL